MQCTAHAKHSGQQCRCAAVTGRTVCHKHGGMTPAGIASPLLKHGRFSKHLPARLHDRYESAAHDRNLLALHDEIALVDVRIGMLLQQASPDDLPQNEAWDAVAAAIDQRRRLVASECRRIGELQQTLTVSEALLLIARLAAIVRAHVHDPAALKAIQQDFAAMLQQQSRQYPGS